MKKVFYGIIMTIMFTFGVYTVYGDYTEAKVSKHNLSLMNNKHLFASVIETGQSFETFTQDNYKKDSVSVSKPSKSIKKNSKTNLKVVKKTSKTSSVKKPTSKISKSKNKKSDPSSKSKKATKDTKSKTSKKKN